jgi:hypothetical protein
VLNPLGVNCLRTFPRHGRVVWGARTLRGADQLASTSGSTCRCAGSRCSSRRASTAARSGWCSSPTTSRSGRRSGSTSAPSCRPLSARAPSRAATPREAYFVKCDSETTTQNDIDLGIVNIVVGFAPLKPAEFVVIKIQQIAGRSRPEEAGDGAVQRQRRAFDPYKNFKFRVKWDGRYVAGVSKVGALKRTTEVVEHREGGDPSPSRKSPGRPSTRRSPSSAASPTTPSSSVGEQGLELRLRPRRRGVAQGLPQGHHHRGLQRGRQLAIAYKVYRCWVSEYQALPELDANANAVAIQTLKLENEGWERDYDVTEPSEPSFRLERSRHPRTERPPTPVVHGIGGVTHGPADPHGGADTGAGSAGRSARAEPLRLTPA